jgi:ABC-2 type transport system permease protein
MRAFLALVKVELLLLSRDPGFLVGTLAVAVLSVFIFGYLFTGAPRDFPLGIVDEDRSTASRQVVEALQDVDGIELSTGSESDELRELHSGDRWAVIVIPSGFEQSIGGAGAEMDVYYNSSNLAAATASRGTVQSVVEGINRSLMDSEPPVRVREEALSTQSLGMIRFILPGMVGLTIMFGSIGTGLFLVAWRQQGILRRLGVTPLRLWMLISSQMTSLLLVVALSASIILVLGRLLFDVSVQGSYVALAAAVLVGALSMLAVGYFVGGRVRTPAAAVAIANLITLPMLFLGGTYFPTDGAPAFMVPLVRLVPLTYLNDALRSVVNEGAGLQSVTTDLAVLAAWTAGMLALSSRIFRWE